MSWAFNLTWIFLDLLFELYFRSGKFFVKMLSNYLVHHQSYLNFVYIKNLHFYVLELSPTSFSDGLILFYFKTDVPFKSVQYLTEN